MSNAPIEEEGRRGWLTSSCGTERDRRNERRFGLAALIWGIALVGSSLLVRRELVTGAAAWLLAVVVVATGVLAIVSYLRFFRGADELTRRIQSHGMVAGFAFAAAVTLTWPAAELVGAPELEAGDALAGVMVAWAVGIVIAQRRYS